MKLRFTTPAQNDLSAIYAYIAERDVAAAGRGDRTPEGCLGSIGSQPASWPSDHPEECTDIFCTDLSVCSLLHAPGG